jgi:hypothetical protein
VAVSRGGAPDCLRQMAAGDGLPAGEEDAGAAAGDGLPAGEEDAGAAAPGVRAFSLSAVARDVRLAGSFTA